MPFISNCGVWLTEAYFLFFKKSLGISEQWTDIFESRDRLFVLITENEVDLIF